MNTETAAWFAGIYEGEGTVAVSGYSLTIRIVCADEELIQMIRDRTSLGSVTGPHQGGRHSKLPQWTWQYSGWDRIAALYDMMRPWLSTRRKARLEELLALRPATYLQRRPYRKRKTIGSYRP